MSAPASRPVHPCVLSLTEASRGAEYSTWARVTGHELPNLVTASANTLSIYSVVDNTGQLRVEHVFGNLAGNVIFLETLTSSNDEPDALLVGFGGQARLTVLRVTDSLLQAESLLDLGPALATHSYGAVSEQDAEIACLATRPGWTTVACVLGGGVAVAVTEVVYHASIRGWLASEPYILPLTALSSQLSATPRNANVGGASAMSTGFGDIISVTFLTGYLEPVLVLLHSDPGGRTWSGRLGREADSGGAPPLHVTALSVSVVHNRTAVLWTHHVSADALHLSSFGSTGCLVTGANTLLFLEAGRIDQVLAVNGFAKATCPSDLQSQIEANPVVKLALCLDGSSIAWLSSSAAVLVLRTGQLYVLQRTSTSWMLLPTGQTLAVGEVTHLSALSLGQMAWLGKILGKGLDLAMGLLFAGSRLGDSMLLGYALETVKMPWTADKLAETTMVKEEPKIKQEPSETETSELDGEYDRILRMEEEALYAPLENDSGPDVVPPSDEDEEMMSPNKRPRVAKFTVVRALTPLDSLVNLGPLGKPCEGPLSQAPPFLVEPDPTAAGVSAGPVFGATAQIFPSGYGSSGGLAIATIPGRDDRMILTEADCLNVRCIFSLPETGIVLLGISEKVGGGVRALRLEPSDGSAGKSELELIEINLDEWCSTSKAREVFQSTLLHAGELSNGQFALIVRVSNEDLAQCGIVVLQEKGGRLEIQGQFALNSGDESRLLSVTPFSNNTVDGQPVVTFGCCWSSGRASVITFNVSQIVDSFSFPGDIKPEDVDPMEEDDEEKELERFYQNESVVAIDLFKASVLFFEKRSSASSEVKPTSQPEEKMSVDTPTKEEFECPGEPESPAPVQDWSKLTVAKLKEELKSRDMVVKGKKADLVAALEESDRQRLNQGATIEQEPPQETIEQKPPQETNLVQEKPNEIDEDHFDFDEDDEELYGSAGRATTRSSIRPSETVVEVTGEEGLFVAVGRQSGKLEVYSVPQNGKDPILQWTSTGCGQGATSLHQETGDSPSHRFPRSHRISIREIRFFPCGPTASKSSDMALPRSLYMAVESTTGDLDLYTAARTIGADASVHFQKSSLRTISRPSQEQARHHNKLVRKRIVSKDADDTSFYFNNLSRFENISGQDGLFASLPRPLWLVAERGKPTALFHRTRHAAPAGGKPRSVSGFCYGFKNTKGGSNTFITLHERVGRVGSQRLTVFDGLSNVFRSQSILPGGGFCIEKIPLGVTVRRIHFLDNPDASNGDHPLYAMLVSREYEDDQSALNDDGLTPEERQQQEEEKEAAKVKRQVEADLGGFDLESEWVEEIERENCFKVDKELGGAPPIRRSAYSLWIVDAASNWAVVDSFELGENEHGLQLQVMDLTEFPEEPGSSNATEEISAEDLATRPFVVIGTAIVDHNGEDVTCKGRVLLLEVKRPTSALVAAVQPVEISLCYEKPIFHGPVTTVSCLNSEGNNRLVIGAGADVNIEQWGNDKLTQVGFFRATMQILDILLFKNFFLLSDAYDSLYFLVWRESDKSLTLLAKDYDPIPVHASGILSRGAAMTFLCHDDRQNLQFFQYAPGEAAARGGNRLVCRADYHLGTQMIAFASHFCRSSLLVQSATPISTLAAVKQQDKFFGRTDDDQRLGAHFGTTDGGVGAVIPVSESVYWRLTALQSILANALESNCALSPRAWRLYRRTPRRGGCRSNDRKKGVIDGDLIYQYADLPLADQEDLASAVGSTVELILDNILEVQCASMMI